MSTHPGMIRVATDLDSYFETEINETARKQGLNLSQMSSMYLARMLCRFVESRAYFTQNPTTNPDEQIKQSLPTLALLWLEGQTQPLGEQYQRFQQVGDLALFTSGFFSERINRSLVDVDYYIAMGGRAYERAGHIRESIQAERDINVFFELSRSFGNLVEVMAEISDKSLLGSDQDILKLYEKWMGSGSDRIRRMLAETGVISAKKSGEGN